MVLHFLAWIEELLKGKERQRRSVDKDRTQGKKGCWVEDKRKLLVERADMDRTSIPILRILQQIPSLEEGK